MRETNPPSGLSGGPLRKLIAASVRIELVRANVSGHQMAQRIGVATSTFSRRMTGEISFSGEELVAIAVQLEIPVATLLADAEATMAQPAPAGVA